MAIPADLAARVERDGFATVPGVLDPASIAVLASALAAAGPLSRHGTTYGARNLFRVPEVRQLAAGPAVRAVVEPILGPDAFAVRGLFFDKSARANWRVAWHQDLAIAVAQRVEAAGFGPWSVKAGVPHVQPPAGVLERMLAVRVHLDASGPENGPLRVVPGSHRGGVLSSAREAAWLQGVAPRACHVPVGGALAMRPLLLHASAPSTDGHRHRRVIHLEFAAAALPRGVAWHEQVRP